MLRGDSVYIKTSELDKPILDNFKGSMTIAGSNIFAYSPLLFFIVFLFSMLNGIGEWRSVQFYFLGSFYFTVFVYIGYLELLFIMFMYIVRIKLKWNLLLKIGRAERSDIEHEYYMNGGFLDLIVIFISWIIFLAIVTASLFVFVGFLGLTGATKYLPE